jgi:hypothetical protein
MKLIYKEEPKEWRKSALLTALGLAILSAVLRWRRRLPVKFWCAMLALLGLVAICAVLQPRWFRGWYRLSLRLGILFQPVHWTLRAGGIFYFYPDAARICAAVDR